MALRHHLKDLNTENSMGTGGVRAPSGRLSAELWLSSRDRAAAMILVPYPTLLKPSHGDTRAK